MVEGIPLHLDYVLATTLHSQAKTDSAGIISVGSYITWLAWGLNILASIDQPTIVRGFKPITTRTIKAMRLLKMSSTSNHHFFDAIPVTQSGSVIPTPKSFTTDSSSFDDTPFWR